MRHSVDLYLRYLSIPQKYGPTTGLFWSTQGDSIITWAGQVFAFTPQVSLFVEGFASQRPVPHFGYLLDLFRLLGFGDAPQGWTAIPKSLAIRKAFRATGASTRNAGAFLGSLCEELPRAVQAPVDDLSSWLTRSPYRNALCAARDSEESMPWTAERFHQYVGEQLDLYSEEDFHYWLRQGQASPDAEGETIARELVAVKPPPRRGSLETLMKERTRLSGAIPLVNAMVSALSLPPRRRTPPQLPLGGYADVTTRGEPEQLLLSQLALDPDDFVRRFAEKELLYFRREEPPERTRENLILLLDQGVRTWGTVRLALSAAVLAFARIARKKKLPFQIRFGSHCSVRIDPAMCDLTELGDLLEASDLSAHPAELLEAEDGDEDCDVVLLTHPRSLVEAEIKSVADELGKHSRLFALTAEEDGQVEFSELRSGEPVCITRIRVDFSATQTRPISPFVPSDDMWRGDVEPIPFPFPFGLTSDKLAGIAFDAEATRLLVATRQPMLHVWTIADGKVEVLPRPLIAGRLATGTHFLGVRDGFIVAGTMDANLFAVHYDFRTRIVKAHRLGKSDGKDARWYSFPDLHAVALRQDFVCRGLDLESGRNMRNPKYAIIPVLAPIKPMCGALDRPVPEPWVEVILRDFSATPVPQHFAIYYNPNRGWLFAGNHLERKSWCPEIEGSRFLEGIRIDQAQFAGGLLALRYIPKGFSFNHWGLIHFDKEPWAFRDLNVRADSLFLLAPNGRYYAVQGKKARVKIVDSQDKKVLLTTVRADIRHVLNVALGRFRMSVFENKRRLDFDWHDGELTVSIHRCDPNATLDPDLVPARKIQSPLTGYDPWRFTAAASCSMDVIVARANQLIMYDTHRSRLVCMFCIRGGRWVAWMPDGTRYGPRDLLGAPATPGALARIAEALREASQP